MAGKTDTWEQKVGIKDDLLPTALIYTRKRPSISTDLIMSNQTYLKFASTLNQR